MMHRVLADDVLGQHGKLETVSKKTHLFFQLCGPHCVPVTVLLMKLSIKDTLWNHLQKKVAVAKIHSLLPILSGPHAGRNKACERFIVLYLGSLTIASRA